MRKEEAQARGLSSVPKVRMLDGRRYCPLGDMLADQGHFGRKTGRNGSSRFMPGFSIALC